MPGDLTSADAQQHFISRVFWLPTLLAAADMCWQGEKCGPSICTAGETLKDVAGNYWQGQTQQAAGVRPWDAIQRNSHADLRHNR